MSQHLFKEHPRFARHRPEEKIIKLAVNLRIGRRGVDVPQIEPLPGEIVGESARPWDQPASVPPVACKTSGLLNSPAAASFRSSSSGVDDQRKYDSRAAMA